MKNLTITVPETVARWARIWAARNNTSVSRLVGDLLQQRMEQDTRYESAMKQYLHAEVKPLKKSGRYPKRDQLHDRSGLR